MQNQSTKNETTLTDNLIIYFIFISILFFKSIKNLLELFSYGIFKKEILTKDSNLGFDIKIKVK